MNREFFARFWLFALFCALPVFATTADSTVNAGSAPEAAQTLPDSAQASLSKAPKSLEDAQVATETASEARAFKAEAPNFQEEADDSDSEPALDDSLADEAPEVDSAFVLGPGSRAFERGKTGIEAIDTLPIYEWDVETDHNSLPLTMALSVLPGGGHFYTGHYVRGGFLLAIEAILAYEVFYNKAYQKDRRFEQAAPYRDSVAYYTSLMMQTTSYSELVELQEQRERYANLVRNINDKKMEEEDLRKAEMAWLIGLHVYGMFDAYGIWANNQGHNVEKRSMMRAFLWALIPGGGQFYNRDYGKAGLVYMGLFGAGVSIWTTQNLIEYYLERRRTMIGEDNDDEEERLTDRITHYRKNRNQYIWGSVIIYLYSIGDAVVDAMLADFDSPLHLAIAPVLEGGVQAAVGLDF